MSHPVDPRDYEVKPSVIATIIIVGLVFWVCAGIIYLIVQI